MDHQEPDHHRKAASPIDHEHQVGRVEIVEHPFVAAVSVAAEDDMTQRFDARFQGRRRRPGIQRDFLDQGVDVAPIRLFRNMRTGGPGQRQRGVGEIDVLVRPLAERAKAFPDGVVRDHVGVFTRT